MDPTEEMKFLMSEILNQFELHQFMLQKITWAIIPESHPTFKCYYSVADCCKDVRTFLLEDLYDIDVGIHYCDAKIQMCRTNTWGHDLKLRDYRLFVIYDNSLEMFHCDVVNRVKDLLFATERTSMTWMPEYMKRKSKFHSENYCKRNSVDYVRETFIKILKSVSDGLENLRRPIFFKGKYNKVKSEVDNSLQDLKDQRPNEHEDASGFFLKDDNGDRVYAVFYKDHVLRVPGDADTIEDLIYIMNDVDKNDYV